MKKKLLLIIGVVLLGVISFIVPKEKEVANSVLIGSENLVKTDKKTVEERMLFVEERLKHEFDMQKNPLTGQIPREEKEQEFENAMFAKQSAYGVRTTTGAFTSRGPSNFGGRTRGFAIDISDNTSNTMIAGGVSSGVFRTTDGGASWVKVSSNSDIHNATAIAQDPRPGFQNIWYYATGERLGNSVAASSSPII